MMGEEEFLAAQFEANRAHLRAVARRMLGSANEADDAVQETWLRLVRIDGADIKNLQGWLTTVVARVCLDMLRARKSRQEDPISAAVEELPAPEVEQEREIADSIGVAMLVVLETLSPAERVAFVLHDMFNVSFEEIAPVVGRSPAAARQLASRGRRRIQGEPQRAESDRARQREIVDAFLAASRAGDFSALLVLLDPAVVLRADAAAVEASLARAGRSGPILKPEIHGRESVANTFQGRAQAARPATVDGVPGLVFAPGGHPFVVFDFVIENGKIIEISLIADAQAIAAIELQF